MTYKNKLINVDKISLSDLTINIDLEKEDGTTTLVSVNPKTGDNIIYLIILYILPI